MHCMIRRLDYTRIPGNNDEELKSACSVGWLLSGVYCLAIVIFATALDVTKCLSDTPVYEHDSEWLYSFLHGVGVIYIVYRFSRKDDQLTPMGNPYLKVGALLFGAVALFGDGIRVGTNFDRQCEGVKPILVVTPIIHVVFIMLQIAYIFFQSNIYVQQHKLLAQFGTMHLIACNLSTWSEVVVNETSEDIARYRQTHTSMRNDLLLEDVPFRNVSNQNAGCNMPISNSTSFRDLEEAASAFIYPCRIEYSLIAAGILYNLWRNIGQAPQNVHHGRTPHATADTHPPSQLQSQLEQQHNTDAAHGQLEPQNTDQKMHNTYVAHGQGQYRDPAEQQHERDVAHRQVQFENALQQMSDTTEEPGQQPREHTEHTPGQENDRQNSLTFQASCHNSIVGLLLGTLLLVTSLLVIVSFSVMHTDPDRKDTAMAIYQGLGITLYTCAMISAWLIMIALRKNVRSPQSNVKLDLSLLVIALGGVFLKTAFTVYAAIFLKKAGQYQSFGIKALTIISAFLEIGQTTFQTVLLWKCLKVTPKDGQSSKYARQAVVILLLINVTFWVTNIFEVKQHETEPLELEFYHAVPWMLITHLCCPLTIFFRFHSASCLFDVWMDSFGEE